MPECESVHIGSLCKVGLEALHLMDDDESDHPAPPSQVLDNLPRYER
jgi:hypothetical protein